jgi:hypothetical protein
MNCPLENRDGVELLLAYSSRKLEAAQTALVAKHMAGCTPCREAVRGQQALWDILDIWEAEPVSADFNRRLYRRIEARTTWWDRVLGPWRTGVYLKGVPLAAAACLVLAAAAMLDRAAAPPPRPARTGSEFAAVAGLQPEQVVNALDEMQALSRFDDSMKLEGPESKM